MLKFLQYKFSRCVDCSNTSLCAPWRGVHRQAHKKSERLFKIQDVIHGGVVVWLHCFIPLGLVERAGRL